MQSIIITLFTLPPKNGKGGIRTHGTFQYAGFQDQSLKPLGHLTFYY